MVKGLLSGVLVLAKPLWISGWGIVDWE